MENVSFEKETEPRRLDVMITGQAGVEEGKRDFEETIGNPLVFGTSKKKASRTSQSRN